MWRYLDYEKQENGFMSFDLTAENIKANKGKRICYVRSADIDRERGYVFVRHARIHSKRYSRLLLNNGDDSIDIRDVLECGIEQTITPNSG